MPLEGNKAIKHNSTAHYKLWFNKRLSTERGDTVVLEAGCMIFTFTHLQK